MAKNVKRGWFIEVINGDKVLCLVEKPSRTVDGITDNWRAVTEVTNTVIELAMADIDLTGVTSSYNEINSRYHNVIVDKVIAMGYRDPRNQNLQNAEYFENLYQKGLKRAKKYSKSSNLSTGRIVPQDF